VSEAQRIDFFLSYTGADVAWAEWAAGVLENAGFSTILQAWDFRPGSNFVLDMDDALRRSDRVMPLLSPAYLSSAFGASEWAAAFATDPKGVEGRLLPIRVADCRPEGLLRRVLGLVSVPVLGIHVARNGCSLREHRGMPGVLLHRQVTRGIATSDGGCMPSTGRRDGSGARLAHGPGGSCVGDVDHHEGA
jgi:hypothetical protein